MRADQPLRRLHRLSLWSTLWNGGLRWSAAIVMVAGIILAGTLVFRLSEADATQRRDENGTIQVAQRNQPPQPAESSKAGAANQPAQPPQGTPLRSEQFTQDSWVVSCVETSGARIKKTCTAVQQLVDTRQKAPVFAWVIGRTPDGTLTNVFQTPTGLLLQRGVEFKVGDTAVRRAHFVVCTTQRCEASLPMDDSIVRDAKASPAGTAVASVTAADGRTVNFSLSMRGFDKVLAALGK